MRLAERNPSGRARSHAGFTLIEIMVAIGIVAVILTISFPFMAQQMHKDSMRQAVKDITDACREARSRAILTGSTTELRIRPGDRTISAVASGGNAAPSFGAVAFSEAEDGEPKPKLSSGGGIFSAKLSDHIIIEFIGVNLIPDLQQLDEVSASFYPNGTSDEFVMVIRSDRGEIRKITTEVVTGVPEVEVVR